MKILQVGSGLHGWAGIEKYILFLDQGLSEKGHEVTVSVSPNTPLAAAMSSSRVEIPVRNKFDLPALAAYLRLFRARQFDLIHTHYNPDFIVVAWAAKLAGKTPLVMTRHVALPWPWLKAKNFSRLYDRIIPVSDASKKRLLESGVPDDRMRVAKAGCPPLEVSKSREAIRQEMGLDSGFHFGFFGRLAPEKGLKVLLEGAQGLPNGATLHIYGDGPLKPLVQAAADASPNIRYHGFRTDVSDCMTGMDAIVIPSIWEEAFPYSALEAMSVGRPIVASNIGGLPELVQHKVNGLLYQPGDCDALSSALTELASDRENASRLGIQGQVIQRREYTIERMADRIEAVYNELV
jgi:glycosyltransferase involved in cell wall biosynthesis